MHMLVKRGAKLSALVLIEAVRNSHEDLVHYLLSQNVIHPDSRVDPGGRTALHSSACKGDIRLAKQLLKWGADPNSADGSGITPLHLASSMDAGEMVRLLIDYGAHPDARDIYRCSPVDLAGRNSHIKQLLLAPRRLGWCTF